MPYAHEHNGITLKSISKDRRIKLSDVDKQNIIKLYETGLYSITGLAKIHNVNKRVIQFLLFPERLQRNKELREIRGGSKKYYDSNKNTESVRSNRQYRQTIFKGE